MPAFQIPNMRFSLECGGLVHQHRFVAVDVEGYGVEAPDAATVVIGASQNHADRLEVLEIADGIVMVEASEDIASNEKVMNNNGKAAKYVEAAGNLLVGVALTSGKAGELITVKMV